MSLVYYDTIFTVFVPLTPIARERLFPHPSGVLNLFANRYCRPNKKDLKPLILSSCLLLG